MSPEEEMLIRLHIPQLCEFLNLTSFARTVNGTKVCWSRKSGFYVNHYGKREGVDTSNIDQARGLLNIYHGVNSLVDSELIRNNLAIWRASAGIPEQVKVGRY